MRKRIIRTTLIMVITLFCASNFFGGKKITPRKLIYTGWDKIDALVNVKKVKIGENTEYLKLDDNEYTSSFDRVFSDVDLLLHFNSNKSKKWDKSVGPNYDIEKYNFIVDDKQKVMGNSCAKFYSYKHSLILKPKQNAWVNRSDSSGSFTIEFWMKPSHTYELSTVMQKYGLAITNGEANKYSGFKIYFKDDMLYFDFINVFKLPSTLSDEEYKEDHLISISTRKRITPNVWKHYALSYNSINGKLALYVNGERVNRIWVTDDKKPGGTVLLPRFDQGEKSALIIGKGFSGLLDEVIISKIAKEDPVLTKDENSSKSIIYNKYSSEEGIILSDIYDLGYSNAFFEDILLDYEVPEGSSITFEYRSRNKYFKKDAPPYKKELEWIPYEFSKRKIAAKPGRYFQWRMKLKAGSGGEVSPVIKRLKLIHSKFNELYPPHKLEAYSKDGKVFFKWVGNIDENISGYKIYFGKKSGNYTFKEPKLINLNTILNRIKPVVVIEDNDLRVGKVYYFSITAVDKYGNESGFSNEVWVQIKKF